MDAPACFLPTVIVRHPKEKLSKCSLRGLEDRDDLRFLQFGKDPLPEMSGYVRLDLEGPLLSEADAGAGLLLLDGTWRLAGRMARALRPQIESVQTRSLPADLVTAYPRAQTLCPDPERGLASVEALYAAHRLMGRPTRGLLRHYHWAEMFLEENADRLGRDGAGMIC